MGKKDGKPGSPTALNGAEFSENLAAIAEKSQKLVNDFLARQAAGSKYGADPLNIGAAFLELTNKMMADPDAILKAQVSFWQDYARLWQHAADRMTGKESPAPFAPEKGDKRFRDPEWEGNLLFDVIKQSYLMTSKWMQNSLREVDGLDAATARKVEFYTRQFVDALSPSNFVMTNPEVLRQTVESNGENLLRGLDNLIEDLERGKGQLAINMTDPSAFEVGKDIAVTPGSVIFQNDLMQLIQYAPATETVYRKPLLICPPWINKFYILDLRPDNSLVKWCVDQGYTLFVISWVNPDRELANKSFEHYMKEGILAALDAIEKATGERQVNAVGYCLGGTLLASTLAYMAAVGDDRIGAATFLATQVEFSDAGELSVFIDDEQIRFLEQKMSDQGYLDGASMSMAFNMLRSNDLIWSFVINNYLLGKEPFPFDLLYWNADSTRLPAAMHSFYLRNMYQKNLLAKPGGIEMAGVPIDLGKIEIPVYIQASKEDHIAPFPSAFKATRLYSGPIQFTLAGSGHIAGVVNPPAAGKYQYWTNAAPKKYDTAEEWVADATEHPGSWWTNWHEWLSGKSGPRVPALNIADGPLPEIEKAPGSYVKVRN